MTPVVEVKIAKTEDFAFLAHCEKAFLKSLDQCKIFDQCCKCKGGSGGQCKCSKVPVLPLLLELATDNCGHCHCHQAAHHCACASNSNKKQKNRDRSKESDAKMSDSEEQDDKEQTEGGEEEQGTAPPLSPKSPKKKSSKSKSNEYKGAIFTLEKDGFHICMDVKQFRYTELSVKVVNDDMIVIEAKHAEREDNASGTVARQIMRKYPIPKESEPENVKAELSPDGILTVKAPLKKQKPSKERVVKIEQMGATGGTDSCHACPCMEEDVVEDKDEKK